MSRKNTNQPECGMELKLAAVRRVLAGVFLIAVFPKNEKENLSMAERNALRKRADSIFEGIL